MTPDERCDVIYDKDWRPQYWGSRSAVLAWVESRLQDHDATQNVKQLQVSCWDGRLFKDVERYVSALGKVPVVSQSVKYDAVMTWDWALRFYGTRDEILSWMVQQDDAEWESYQVYLGASGMTMTLAQYQYPRET